MSGVGADERAQQMDRINQMLVPVPPSSCEQVITTELIQKVRAAPARARARAPTRAPRSPGEPARARGAVGGGRTD